MKIIPSLLILALAASTPAMATTVIAPGGAGTAQGPAPLRFYGNGGSRVQQIYDASFFTGLSTISSVSFRAFPGAGPSGFFSNSVTVSDSLVRLSTTPVSANENSGLQPGATFAANLGADTATVFSGGFTLTTAATGMGSQPFDYTLNFTTPFQYNPAGGNLVLDFLIPVGATVGGAGFGFLTFDNANLDNDGVRSVIDINNGAAVSGVLDTSAAISAFEVTSVGAIPEPATWALMITGFGLAGGALRARRRTAGMAVVHV
jgi:hypothetical protein